MNIDQENIPEGTEETFVETMEDVKIPLEEIKTARQKQIELAGQIRFHKVALTEVKQKVGSKCTFLSHMITKGTIWFLAHLNINGEKRIVRISTGKTNSNELEAENYKALFNQLSDYVTGKKNI